MHRGPRKEQRAKQPQHWDEHDAPPAQDARRAEQHTAAVPPFFFACISFAQSLDRDFNPFATMRANDVRFFLAGFILEEIGNATADNVCNSL